MCQDITRPDWEIIDKTTDGHRSLHDWRGRDSGCPIQTQTLWVKKATELGVSCLLKFEARTYKMIQR
jgi:hypothetical protein